MLTSAIIPEDESDASSLFSHLGRCGRTVLSGGGMSQGHHPLSVLLMGPLRRRASEEDVPCTSLALKHPVPVDGYLERMRFGLVRGGGL